jgi:hypothetical protein|mmetsp:Transcript_77710/g.130447  ORF Transcript_77710/g.130447 Transcript_77710/m.130447 type:complete len:253 (+) Transcript_77710:2469-3227(+)
MSEGPGLWDGGHYVIMLCIGPRGLCILLLRVTQAEGTSSVQVHGSPHTSRAPSLVMQGLPVSWHGASPRGRCFFFLPSRASDAGAAKRPRRRAMRPRPTSACLCHLPQTNYGMADRVASVADRHGPAPWEAILPSDTCSCSTHAAAHICRRFTPVTKLICPCKLQGHTGRDTHRDTHPPTHTHTHTHRPMQAVLYNMVLLFTHTHTHGERERERDRDTGDASMYLHSEAGMLPSALHSAVLQQLFRPGLDFA